MIIPIEKEVIIIEPHPDDIFLGMYSFGKTQGIFDENPYVYQLTRGELDFETKKIDSVMAAQRHKETLNFLDEVRIDASCLREFEIPDGAVYRSTVANMVRNELMNEGLEPQDCIVFVTSVWDSHPDHKEAAHGVAALNWFELYEYSIDDRPSKTVPGDDIHIKGLKTAFDIHCGKEKTQDFIRLYPSQWENLRKTKHPSLFKRLNMERIIKIR